MLDRIEAAYLNILRVVVLLVATIALVLAVLAAIKLVPDIASQFSGISKHDVEQADLSQFISDQRASIVNNGSADQSTNPPAQSEPSAPDAIRRAVVNVVKYNKTRLHSDIDPSTATTMLLSFRQNLPDKYQEGYDTSVLALSEQLLSSKGVPLSADQQSALFKWHADQYQSAADAAEEKKARASASALQSLEVAAAAFGFFLSIVFCFVVVKIERNLRPQMSGDPRANARGGASTSSPPVS